MTEPEVASSDATNIATRIRREGDEYVVDGRKWYASGAMNPNCRIFIVMGKTDPDAPRHRQQSMILVPRETAGRRGRSGRCRSSATATSGTAGTPRCVFTGVRVPAANLIAGEGEGFAIAQARLGPGRIHHCMRLIGMAERAIATDVPAGRGADRVRPAAGRAGRGARVDRRVAGACRTGPAAGAQDRLADGHGRQQGRAHRDPGHQDRRPRDGGMGAGQGDPGARRRRGRARTSRWPSCGRRPARCGWPTARTRCTGVSLAKAELARQAKAREARAARSAGE